MGNRADLTGQVFYRLAVVSFAGSDKHKKAAWNCRCECGSMSVVVTSKLKNGSTKSCGCLSAERLASGDANRKHSMSSTDEYWVWSDMIRRCENKNRSDYHRYGGRGISVCEKWRNSVTEFVADMEPRPSPKHSIDRIDNDGNYEPGNCRWATPKEQRANQRIRKKQPGKTSPFRGVSAVNRKGRRRCWLATITTSGNNIRLYRRTALAAALAYDDAVCCIGADRGLLNFPERKQVQK